MLQRLAQIAPRSLAALGAPQQPASLLAAATRLLGAVEQHQRAALRTGAPWRSSEQQPEPGAQPELPRQALINRMLYRSRQRGFLELDLLIGMWAEKELPRMSAPEIAEFEAVLDQENPDMFKWLTGQEGVPPPLQSNSVFQRLRQHVKAMTDEHHNVPSPASGSEQQKEWVRGWTDSGAELAGGESAAGKSS
ncbi:ankyrin repeat family isoform A [Chlorella sorokiniana]|uniref:Ankyrin repeat family isoform A n=1 Tax=Chlorella sorokiniana TaxID=3076 RepID=A0A2P6TMG3_CHLSO|nr:ankyrin repeat family isoform A [Chlorella sorokiniana]|eukprot:PRW45532.1 ankyrin repeat family isoform A [Chlorella sorokiniana]